jgi:hypothetical protein
MLKRKLSTVEGGGQTVTVKLADVPEYLQSGELFKSMQCEDGDSSHGDDEIEVPVNCVKPDESVYSVDDAWSLMHSLLYWIAGIDLPPSLVTFCLSPSGKGLSRTFWTQLVSQFTNLDVLKRMATSCDMSPVAKVRIALLTGDITLVRTVHETLQCGLPLTACTVAAKTGSLACL